MYIYTYIHTYIHTVSAHHIEDGEHWKGFQQKGMLGSILVDAEYGKEHKSTQATKTMIWKEVCFVLCVCVFVCVVLGSILVDAEYGKSTKAHKQSIKTMFWKEVCFVLCMHACECVYVCVFRTSNQYNDLERGVMYTVYMHVCVQHACICMFFKKCFCTSDQDHAYIRTCIHTCMSDAVRCR